MKKWFKRGVIGLAVLTMVAVVGVAIFLLTFDPSAYKDKLSERVHARYDRTLTITGDIELSLFPRLGLGVQGVSLSEVGRPDDEFVAIDSAHVAVAVWPLLFNKLVVDHVVVDGFQARVHRDTQGRFNFQDLLLGGIQAGIQAADETTKAAEIGTSTARTEMRVDIAGLDLHEGEIFLRDEQNSVVLRVLGINVNTGRITFQQPFDINVSARVEGDTPAVALDVTGQALLKLDPAALQYAAQRLDLRVAGDLPDIKAKALSARGNVSFDALLRSLDVSDMELAFQGDLTGRDMTDVNASLTVPKLSVDPVHQNLGLDKFALRVRGTMQAQAFELVVDAPALQLSATQAKGDAITGRWHNDGANALDATFNLTGLSGSTDVLDLREAKLDVELKRGERSVKVLMASPLTLDVGQRSAALTAMQGEVDIDDPALPKGEMRIPVIGSLSTDLRKGQALVTIKAVLEGGEFDLNAQIDQLLAQPNIVFKLAVDTLDLDKLVPPAPIAALAPEPPSGRGDDRRTGTPPERAQADAQADATVDFSALRNVMASGMVHIGELRVRGIKASEVVATLALEQGRLDVSDLAANFYQGRLTGGLYIDARGGNALGTKLTLSEVALDSLLSDLAGTSRLRGKGYVVFDLNTTGNTPAAWRNALSGTVQAQLRDGAIQGINVAQTLREFKTALGGGSLQGVMRTEVARETDFSELDANLSFAEGVGTVRKLNLVAPLLHLSQGSPAIVNIANNTLDLVVNVRVVNAATGQAGKDFDVLKGITLPVHLVGPIEKPAYSLVWDKLGSQAVRRTLESRIKKSLLSGTEKKALQDRGVHELGNMLRGVLRP